jgi:hypothetical protein
MTSVSSPAPAPAGVVVPAERRKRLGQYFTGGPTARLLAALADVRGARTILDPMAGSGDMLAASWEVGGRPDTIGAIEIDPVAHAQCVATLAGGHDGAAAVIKGNAFSVETVRKLPSSSWDLVITNPPYVRYQSGSHAVAGEAGLPSAAEVRQGLVEIVGELPALDDADRALFEALVRGYSGLADLAVPSWMFCAALVAPRGTLAMLVPTTWLNRDYAHPVQYLLARWFDIHCVVEDADAAWFSDALVRTTLVVAKRVARRPSAFMAAEGAGYPYVKLRADAAGEDTLVAGMFPDADTPELVFAEAVERWRRERVTLRTDCVAVDWVAGEHTIERLRGAVSRAKWLRVVEPAPLGGRAPSARPMLPFQLSTAVRGVPQDFLTLADLGWRVGQGLRTGANQFFYADAVGATSEDGERLRWGDALQSSEAVVPGAAVRPVLRRQAHLPCEGFEVRAGDLTGRVLTLSEYGLPEDVDELPEHRFSPVPAQLAALIRHVARLDLGTPGAPRFISRLSAVVTNVRQWDPTRPDQAPRFWYQLPPLTDRHFPELLIPRINNGHAKTFSNLGREAVIDANFSTLWPVPEATVDGYGMLALLNSSWCVTALELGATVLGGGALKVEAAHLRALAIPVLDDGRWRKLEALGRQLTTSPQGGAAEALRVIDAELGLTAKHLDQVRALAADSLRARSG